MRLTMRTRAKTRIPNWVISAAGAVAAMIIARLIRR
ncbi:hypothetical protein Tmar_0110 [Thermaerobacter marianensis DSM 12885]|uniref:Uncharacterized protein n=1 Tax=Thermaerobacter marianensis (strain ATCC 700841 / DSM 12885 / JCM 10246 / 7p75a) TaxID=644966 RepID=E6SL33_THEM7|nr:hypothetical protein Tmar_0110 [Thermaerobacter marianensis DSM 12885]